MEDHEKTPLLPSYNDSPATVIPMPSNEHLLDDDDDDDQASVQSVVPIHQPKPIYPAATPISADHSRNSPSHPSLVGGHNPGILGGAGAIATPPPRNNTPRLLRQRDRFRSNRPSARNVFSCLGVTLLIFFLYLTVTSLMHPPPMGPGRKSGIDVGVRHIFDETLNSRRVWDRLAEMTDLYGPRIIGSEALEKSIDWMVTMMESDNLTTMTEEVEVDYWQRNEESAVLILPTRPPKKLAMLGLGGSVGTGPEGIEAEVVVVDDIAQLATMGNDTISGKIVLFDTVWKNYQTTVPSQSRGALEAENYGAKAVLVRSVTPYSLGTPHTGQMSPSSIPAAAITTEDADYIRRVYNRYLTAQNDTSPFKDDFVAPRVKLMMGATLEPNGRKTRNIIAEVKGRIHPEEVVIISGHIDSWDVGSGAVDDGAGFFIAWEALRAISTYAMAPRRTIRVVGWTGEETKQWGAHAYMNSHKKEIPNHVFALESDTGVFTPWGIIATGTDHSMAILHEVGERFLSGVGGGNVSRTDVGESDLGPLAKAGVPCAGFFSIDPITRNAPTTAGVETYFRYHHSEADVVSVLKPEELAEGAASIGTWAYVVAEMEDRLDRNESDEVQEL
ncbi:hypothetical protein BDF19DRAFT_476904 [Syncephalis fuscata]|nr:hypothetical protein BDF19DRAFT_476904 [Syncephalis fuscata]